MSTNRLDFTRDVDSLLEHVAATPGFDPRAPRTWTFALRGTDYPLLQKLASDALEDAFLLAVRDDLPIDDLPPWADPTPGQSMLLATIARRLRNTQVRFLANFFAEIAEDCDLTFDGISSVEITDNDDEDRSETLEHALKRMASLDALGIPPEEYISYVFQLTAPDEETANIMCRALEEREFDAAQALEDYGEFAVFAERRGPAQPEFLRETYAICEEVAQAHSAIVHGVSVITEVSDESDFDEDDEDDEGDEDDHEDFADEDDDENGDEDEIEDDK